MIIYAVRLLLICLGGKVIGEMDPITPTKNVFALMISSLCKKWYQVVKLFPSNISTAEELYSIVNSVINDIEKCGMFVEVLVTDNYSLNVRLFKLYSSDQKTLLPVVPHPTRPERKLFILFDFCPYNQVNKKHLAKLEGL